ncbi:MAG: HAD family phosphatase [Deltaproteobacteria bacterium]|nr:HAD family phosphatase [Deltaproteobacteria bacterium]
MKAVIFDMDGVLIDSEPLHILSDKTLLKRLNIETTENYLDKYVGVTSTVAWKEIINEFNIQNSLQEILNIQLSLELKLLKQGNYNAIEGIPDLLKELYVHYIPIGVASSSSGMFIKEVLKKIRIEKYIMTWVSGENIEKSKPEPDIFLRAAELLQVNPEECIVIEDSKNGVLAAKKAGMKCIGYKNINSGNQDLSKADIIVDKIQEINLNKMKNYFK